MRDSLRSALSVLLVVAVVVGGLPALAPTTAAQSGAPDGMTTIGSTQISEDLPSGADVPIRASDLEGSISSSAHASTMDVVLTTPERASDYVDGAGETNTISAGNLAIVISDDENHGSRTIGLDRDLLDKLGYEPTAVFGVHSSGDEWSAPVTYEDDVATFEVERFSSNTVTFSGGIGLDGSSASDGTQYQYELDSLDGVSDYSINLTGVTNTQPMTTSGASSDGDQPNISIGGAEDPESASITLTSASGTQRLASGGRETIGGSVGDSLTQTLDVGDQTANELYVGFIASSSSGDDWNNVEVSIDLNGESVGSVQGSRDGSSSIVREEQFDISDVSGSNDVTFTVEALDTTATSPEVEAYVYHGGGDTTGAVLRGPESATTTVTVPDTGDSVSLSGNSVTKNISITQQTDHLTFSGDSVDWILEYEARSTTRDPVVEVNGYETGYDGTLSEGETVSLPTQTAWISEGTNRVNISTSSPSSGPGSLVDMDYSHEASSVSTSAEVNATTWREEVTVSNTFPGAQSGATARITFSEETVGIVDVEERINSNDSADWTPVHESDYSWSSNDSALVVELGDVSADTDVELRATGSKVDVVNGSIDVIEPTIEGNTLDSRIEVLSAGSEGVGIEVTGTAPDPLIHYLHDPSYSEEAYAEVSPSGSQTLRLPAAFEGATTNVRTAPIEVNPSNAPVRVTIEDRDEPRFTFEHTSEGAPGDVEVTYHEALPSETYQLYSVARELNDGDKVETEDGSVTLVSSGWEGSYLVELAEMSSGVINATGGDGGSSGGGAVLSILAVLFGTAVPIVGTFFVGRRFEVGRSSTRLLVGLVAVSGTLLALELAGGRLVTQALYVLSDVSGLAIAGAVESGVATVLIGIVILVGMWVVNLRTEEDIPRWLMGLSTVLVVVWMLEAISGGVLTSGLDEVAPVMWLIGGGGGFVLLFLWIRARGEPNTVISVTGRTQQ